VNFPVITVTSKKEEGFPKDQQWDALAETPFCITAIEYPLERAPFMRYTERLG
jgi:hypothetical protein